MLSPDVGPCDKHPIRTTSFTGERYSHPMVKPSVSPETTTKTLGVGLAGGLLFWLLGLPLPWLSGAAAGVAAASLSGRTLGIHQALRETAILLLGMTMGATVTPETLHMLPRWPATLIGLAGAMFSIMVSGAWYLERVHGLDRATARLASMPGALNFVMALAFETNSDPRRVAIIQIVRMTAILLLLPTLVAIMGGHAPTTVVRNPGAAIKIGQLMILGGACALGALAFRRLGTPAPSLFGAMLVGAMLYGPGLLDTGIPVWLMLAVLAVLGSMIGSNFAGADMGLFVETAKAGLGSLAVAVLVALAWAWPLSLLVGLPVIQVWLAFAPGGVETTAILALSLGLDAAYVTSHHIVRVVILNITVPFWIAAYMKDKEPGPAMEKAA